MSDFREVSNIKYLIPLYFCEGGRGKIVMYKSKKILWNF